MEILQSENPINRLPKFMDFMIDAATNNEVGFYYIEAGDVGMILALHDQFEKLGLKTTFAYTTPVFAAYLLFDDKLYNQQGPVSLCIRPQDELVAVESGDELKKAAIQHDYNVEQIELDYDSARTIIETALEYETDFSGFALRLDADAALTEKEASSFYWMLRDEGSRAMLVALAQSQAGSLTELLDQALTDPQGRLHHAVKHMWSADDIGCLKKLAEVPAFEEQVMGINSRIAETSFWAFVEEFGASSQLSLKR